jgi:hypothetical protein
MPAIGFGTLIPDAAATISATRDALQAGFRHFDCAERYRNEREVGEALQAGLAAGKIARKDIFVTTKLWNSNHRPERVEPAFEASLNRLGLNYLDLYLIHTPFAFQPGDEQDPRDQDGNVLYDDGVTLLDTWKAMESLVDHGRCRAVGHRLERSVAHLRICEDQAGRGSSRSTSVSAGNGASAILQAEERCVLGFRPIGSRNKAGAARRSSHFGDCCTSWKDAGTGAVGMGGAARHGFAYHAQNRGPRAGESQYLPPPGRRV